MTRESKRWAGIIIFALVLLAIVVACAQDDIQEMGVTNLSSLHLEDTGATATPVFMVDQDGAGAIAVFMDAGTPVASIYDGGATNWTGAMDFDSTLDMSNNAISNIGNAGTDFDTDGGLTLAGGFVAAIDVLTVAAAPAAGSGGDLIDLTDTFAIANGSDAMIGFDMNLTGANHTGASNSTIGIDLGLTTPDPQVPETGLLITDADWDYAIDTGDVPIFSSAQVWMEDFFGDTIAAEVVLLSGSDESALDPVIAEAQFGTVAMQAGNSNTNVAADASELALGLHWMADQHSLVYETRIYVDDITTVHICVGMSDVATLEMPFDLTTDTPAANADDFVGFCFDTDATTDEWWFVGVDETVVSTGVLTTGVAPVNGAYQIFRIEIDAGGEDARGYINGTLEGTLTANVIDIDVGLTPIVVINSLVAGTRTLTLDYIYVGAQRQ